MGMERREMNKEQFWKALTSKPLYKDCMNCKHNDSHEGLGHCDDTGCLVDPAEDPGWEWNGVWQE